MQRPTCTRLRVRTPADAHVIFHAVSLKILPMVSRRLDNEERRAISSGCVFVWEERGPNAEATGLGIERWTDSIRWGPSRVRDEFLFYQEREPAPSDVDMTSDSDTTSPSHSTPSQGPMRDNLIKQTYPGRRKWHLIAYFTQESVEYLRTIDDISQLAAIHVPPNRYISARSARPKPTPIPGADGEFPFPPPIDIGGCQGWGHLGGRPGRGLNGILAPLRYLQNIPPPRRHPMDEEALKSFTPGLASSR
ncbi:Gti1/Pac2 family-domain-containing protein [Infundibulicybe gibba]|nr:Gti1/Pac2 family-domain-containing protein [Infundibulicybe gibba]